MRCPSRLSHARTWIIMQYSPTRRERIAIATPPWVDHRAIDALREEAKRLTETTGIRHEVDHIYPICSDTICGLHVHTNLRVIMGRDNWLKGNRWVDV